MTTSTEELLRGFAVTHRIDTSSWRTKTQGSSWVFSGIEDGSVAEAFRIYLRTKAGMVAEVLGPVDLGGSWTVVAIEDAGHGQMSNP